MITETRRRFGWRECGLIALILVPLLYLYLIHGAPVAQDRGYHVFADARTCLGLRNFGNVASNIAFLAVGVLGILWCCKSPEAPATRSWLVFFAGVALVFAGSGHYHAAPNDDTLVWDRLPMTIAFMGLFVALLSEHLASALERKLLLPALAVGIASVILWRVLGDLRMYIWVQLTPLLVIPYVVTVFPVRHSHGHYLLYGVGFYALAKIAEHFDYDIFLLTGNMISGHSLKHLLAAVAPLYVLLMLRRRSQSLTPVASSQ